MFSKINKNKSKQGNPIASDPLCLNSVNQQQLKEKTLILLKSLKLLKPIITVKWETNQRKLIERERERERERALWEKLPMSSRLGLCQHDSNCKIECESHLQGMDGWQCGCRLYCYVVEVKETRVSLFDWYEVLVWI